MSHADSPPTPRRIRSFVRREGRITAAQKRAFNEHWERWGLGPGNVAIHAGQLFPNCRRIVVEIGFGMGDSLLQMATEQPETGFIGIDVHRPGVGRLLAGLAERQLDNVRVYCHDAVEVLGQCLAAESLDQVLLLFPDPWPKKRHHKRRLVQPAFVELVRSRLRPGGLFHLATDWESYAGQMMTVMSNAPGWHNCSGAGLFLPTPPPRPATKFERRGQGLGHGVWDLLFARQDDDTAPGIKTPPEAR